MKIYNIKGSRIKDEIKQLIGANFDAELICKNKYITTEMKSFNNDGELRPEQAQCATDLLTLTNSVYISDKSYYPQTPFEECKYILKEKEIKRLVTKD